MNKKLIAKTLGAILLAGQIVPTMGTVAYGTQVMSTSDTKSVVSHLYQEEVKRSTEIGKVVETGEAVTVFSELERDEALKQAYLDAYAVKPLEATDPSMMTGIQGFFPGAPDIDEFPAASALIDGDTTTFWKSFYYPREEKEIYDSEARVAFRFNQEDVGAIHSIILRGQDGYESESPLKIEIYEGDEEYASSGLVKVNTIVNTQAVASDYIEIPLGREITKPYIHVRITGVDGGSHARFTEVAFLKEDTAREGIKTLFTDNMFVEVSDAYRTQEQLDTLAKQVEGHLLGDFYTEHIQVARAYIDNAERPDRYAMELIPTGDVNAYEKEMQLSMALSETQPIGYYAQAGETIEVYVESGPNGELPKIGFGQVGRIDNESYTSMGYFEKVGEAIGVDSSLNLTQLKEGYNQITVPNVPLGEGRYGRKHPYAIYFSYMGNTKSTEGAKVRVSGDALNPYPVYRYGVDDIEQYREELANYKGAQMTHFITERFQLSTTVDVMETIVNDPSYDNEAKVALLDNHAEAIYAFAGIDKEAIRGKLHLAASDATPPSGGAAFAGQGVVHMPYTWGEEIMLSDYNAVFTHEFFHQLGNIYLNIWESPQVMSEDFVKLMLGYDIYTEETVFLDNYINYLGTKGMTQFDGDDLINQDKEYKIGRYSQEAIFMLPLLFFGEDTYGVELYGEAAKLLRSGTHDIPLNQPSGTLPVINRGNVGQNWLMTFSVVLGYDLRPYFEYFNAPITSQTHAYIERKLSDGTIEPLDGKLEKLYLTTPKTTIARQQQLPLFTETTRVTLDIDKGSSRWTLDMDVSEHEDSVLAYEIYKKTNDGDYAFWGISRDGQFVVQQNLDTSNPRYIDLSDANTHTFYAIAYDYELNATAPSYTEEESSVDKTALKAIFEEADAKIESEYSAKAWAWFIDSREAFREIYVDPNATQDDVDYAVFIMQMELDTLEKAKGEVDIVVDKSQLQAAIDRAEQLNASDYTQESWLVVSEKLEIAKNVMQSTGTSIDNAHVAKMTQNLNDAIDSLVLN